MYERSRAEMVQRYVVEPGIEDPRIHAAMLKVPRHEFVDQALAHQAYQGKSLPIYGGQTISHPTTVAWMRSPTSTFEIWTFSTLFTSSSCS